MARMTQPAPKHRPGEQRPGETLRVGALARLTVRTLHYYDEIGLVRPVRAASGHRLYDRAAVERLYRVQLMRALGYSLAEAGAALERTDWDPADLARRAVAGLDARLADQHRLRDRLAATVTDPSLHDDLPYILTTLEELTMTDTVRRRIPTLVYRDVGAAHDWLVRTFGFEPGRVDVDPAGVAVHAEVTAGDGVIWLHRVAPEFGLDSPQTLGAETAGISVIVDDVDAHHARSLAEGARIRYAPVDQPYGYREYAALDLDDRLWAFLTPIG